MNIILRELKANLKSFLIWAVSLVAIYYVASIEFEAFQGSETIANAMEQFEALFTAIGAASTDMTTPEGFLSILSIYIFLPTAIYSGLLGSGIISKEEKDKTAEYLFTLPVSRQKVLTSKLIVAFIYSLLLDLAIIGGCYLAFVRFNPDPIFYTFIGNLSIGVFLTQLFFLSIGLALASVLKQYKSSGGITVIILTSAYLLTILIGFVEELEFLMYVSPFNYFSSENMLNSNFELPYILITIGVVIAGVSTLYITYPKRDLYI